MTCNGANWPEFLDARVVVFRHQGRWRGGLLERAAEAKGRFRRRRRSRGAELGAGSALELPLVDLKRQYLSIKEEIDAALQDAVASTEYILGAEVARFEEEFADYCGVRYCIGVGSGTAAIHLTLEALGVSEGDEVIVPANTFFGTVLPVLKLGATPVLVDCEEQTATIDADRVSEAISSRTKAVLAVHLYGHCADMDPLEQLCASQGVLLVEDACQAHGARYKGRRAGSLGKAAAFSFYPSKNLGAYGDGGAVTTDDQKLAERIQLLRNLGQSSKYVHVAEGWNERLDTIQAAVLRVKLRHLDRWNALRRQHAEAYEEALANTGVRTQQAAPWAEHVWHVYVVRTPKREELRSALAAQGIAASMHYPLPLHEQPALAHLDYKRGAFPVTEAWSNELLSLPMFAELEPHEIKQVTEIIDAWKEAAA
jgi:dTDP-4-amino-4,6-dideoxygalactose transaminase